MAKRQSKLNRADCFSGLPIELLMLIAECLSNRELSCFLRVNRRMYQALIDMLCRRNIEQQGSSALLSAVQNNHVEMVCRLVRLKADVNTTSVGSNWRLTLPFLELVGPNSLIVQEFSSCQRLRAQNRSPLLIAVANDNLRLVKILLKTGAHLQPHCQLTDVTPLELAIRTRNIPIARVLINAYDDINDFVVSNWTAVAIASDVRQVEILKYLLKKGATPVIPDEVFNSLLSVEHPYCERRCRRLNGYETISDNLNRTVYRHRLDDTSLEILRFLMHHGLETTDQQRQQGKTHSDPRVRYIFLVYDPTSNIQGSRENGDIDDLAAQLHDFPPLERTIEPPHSIENTFWSHSNTQNLKASFTPVVEQSHTPAEKHTLEDYNPFPPLLPVQDEPRNATESRCMMSEVGKDPAAHIDTLNNWKRFREQQVPVSETSPTSSEPSASNDGVKKKKKKKEKWMKLQV